MKNTRKKVLSVLLTLVLAAVISVLSVAPVQAVASTSWEKLNGSTGGQTIGTNGQTKYYYIDANTTCSNSNTGGSGLTIADGATVYIYIPANVTLTCTGGSGSGKTGGGAGIYLPSGSTLYIIGNGTIIATGGAAANGSNGGAGKNGTCTFDAGTYYGGAGGKGGDGGGGGGAGIGTSGSAGGAGGTGGSGDGGTHDQDHIYAKRGSAGSAGTGPNKNYGTLKIQSTITRTLTGGAAGTKGGSAGAKGNSAFDTGFSITVWENRHTAGGGGGGGGGGAGYAGAGYGSGGGGGGGGAGGNGAGAYWRTYSDGVWWVVPANGGKGGTGVKNGTAGTDQWDEHSSASSGSYWTGYKDYYYSSNSGGTGGGNATAATPGTGILGATVTYYPQNGDSTFTANATVGEDMPAVTMPTRAGYTFAGWYDAASGGNRYYNANNVSEKKMLYYDIALYAQWTANTYTVSFNQNGGSDGQTSNVTATYDAAMPGTVTKPTRTGYTFAGYFDATSGGTKYYNADGTSAKIWDKTVATTLYAQWTPNTYTIKYDANGGEGAPANGTATYDANLSEVSVPTWEKHVFAGYYTEADGEGTQYIDKDGKGVKAWDKTSDTTLYAHWLAPVSIDGLSLLLDGDIGLWFHVTVNDKDLKTSGSYMTLTIGGKSGRTKTVRLTETSTDASGRYLFAFDVNSIQLAQKVTATFYGADGTVYDSVSQSVEDYYNLIKDQSTNANEKALVKALVNYGYYAQQALSKTNGWVIGTDYATSTNCGTPTTTDLTAYKPVITGSSTHVTGLNVSLLLDNKTTLCLYFTTSDKLAPTVTVDGATPSMEKMSDGRWLVRISNIDALHLGDVHTVTADGRTIYLSALSYGSVITGDANKNAICALADYYQAALTYAGKTVMTEATVENAEYAGSAITPAVTVKAGETTLEATQYTVTWSGNLINAGTYTGVITGKDNNILGSLTVTFTITPKQITAPEPSTNLIYNGENQLYNGENQLCVDDAPGCTLGGVYQATDAGNYTMTATLNDTANTCWKDGTTDEKIITWSIAKATPTVASAISITYYTNGGDITVTGGAMNPAEGKYRFETAPTENGTATAIFTPNDTTNYDTVPVEVTVTLSGTAKTSAVKIPKT